MPKATIIHLGSNGFQKSVFLSHPCNMWFRVCYDLSTGSHISSFSVPTHYCEQRAELPVIWDGKLLVWSLCSAHPVYFAAVNTANPLQRRHNERGGVSNNRRRDCLFWRRSRKISKLRATGLCEVNPPVTGRFPSQRANKAENVSIWWRHHASLLMTRKKIHTPVPMTF